MRSFVIGGPYYQSKIDVRTAMTVHTIISAAPSHAWECTDWLAEDGLLDLSRNKLMDAAIARRADWLISLDADISIKNPESVFASLSLESDPKIAVVGFPAKCGHGGWNVVIDGHAIRDPLVKRRDVERVGTGAIAFRLGWYVKHWDKEAPFFATFCLRKDDTRKFYAVGEDYGHCNAVRSFGGRVIADPGVKVIHHTARAGSPAARLDDVE